jgi:hypothetical protein
MDTPYDNLPKGQMAYIRLVSRESLPDDIRAQIPGDEPIWGVHAPDGECLALARHRSDAFMLARENDWAPVSVH